MARERGPFDDKFERGYVPCDEPPGFEEREYALWKAAGGQVDQPRMRARTDTRNLEELLCWLEYGRRSGYAAGRQSTAQEHHWADLLRGLLESHKALLAVGEDLLIWADVVRNVISAGGPETAVALARAAVPKARGT